jgi:hypothetical protein
LRGVARGLMPVPLPGYDASTSPWVLKSLSALTAGDLSHWFVLYRLLLFPDELEPGLCARSLLGDNGNQLDALFHIELVLLDRLAIEAVGNFTHRCDITLERLSYESGTSTRLPESHSRQKPPGWAPARDLRTDPAEFRRACSRRVVTSCRKQLEEAQDGPLLLLGHHPRRRINRERLGAQSR